MVDTIETVLPSNATPFERSMAEVMDARAPLSPQISRLGTIGATEFPADWLPWLLIHYGLDKIAPYVGDLLTALIEGRRWQRVRGTPAATEDFVLAWLGFVGLDVPDGYGGAGPIEEERVGDVKWWLYQIALAAAPDGLKNVARLIGADDLSRNAGMVLGRVYGGYDVRALRWDGGKYDDALYDDWSGVVLPAIGKPHLSFGRNHGSTIEADNDDVPTSVFSELATTCRFEGGFIYDRSRWDDDIYDLSELSIVPDFFSETSVHVVADSGGCWPRAPWPGERWVDFAVVYGGAD